MERRWLQGNFAAAAGLEDGLERRLSKAHGAATPAARRRAEQRRRRGRDADAEWGVGEEISSPWRRGSARWWRARRPRLQGGR
jgi:hypothetical protein